MQRPRTYWQFVALALVLGALALLNARCTQNVYVQKGAVQVGPEDLESLFKLPPEARDLVPDGPEPWHMETPTTLPEDAVQKFLEDFNAQHR